MKKIIILLVLILALIGGVYLDLAPVIVPDYIGKIFHFLGFAFITLLLTVLYRQFFGTKKLNVFLVSVLLIGGIIAGLSEYLQRSVILRSCTYDDWLANLSGIAVVILSVYLINAKHEKEIEVLKEKQDSEEFF